MTPGVLDDTVRPIVRPPALGVTLELHAAPAGGDVVGLPGVLHAVLRGHSLIAHSFGSTAAPVVEVF
jgi:hypothetical protein